MNESVTRLWARLENWWDGQVPGVVAGLAPPADEATLAAAEERMGRALPAALRELLAVHNGGAEVIGGWDLLSADGIVDAHRFLLEDEPAGLPFVATVGGNYLCLDDVGRVFWNYRDSGPGEPIAPSLTAWLTRIVDCVESGAIVFNADRAEFLPFYGATGFNLAFQDDPPVRLDVTHAEVALAGPRTVVPRAVESAGPLPRGARIEFVADGAVTAVWLLDRLRETEGASVTEYNVFIQELELAPTAHIATSAVLRMVGLTAGDDVWVHLERV